jgi:hypothetical protein
VVFFEHGGRPYYVIPAWDSHQRTEKKAKAKEGLMEASESAIVAAQRHKSESPTDSADSPTHTSGTSVPGRGKGTGEREIGKGNNGGGVGQVCHQGQGDEPPPRKCPKHINIPDPPNCGSCRNYRIASDAWEAQQKKAELDQLEERRQQRDAEKALADNCPLCNGTKFIQVDEDTVRACTHQEAM